MTSDAAAHRPSSVVALAAVPVKTRAQHRALETYNHRLQFAKGSNVILQVPKSRIERIVDFVLQKEKFGQVEVLGSFETEVCRTVCLLFLKTDRPVELMKKLYEFPFVVSSLSKVHLVTGDILQGKLSNDVVHREAFRHLQCLSQQSTNEKIIVRVQIFPPSLQKHILAAFEADEEKLDRMRIFVSPTGTTHSLSVVQLTPDEKDGSAGLYMFGVCCSDKRVDKTIRGANENKDDICRAYFKLQEAFDRYFEQTPASTVTRSFPIALDCGASPGGWTKYLSETLNCDRVYSIDPGALLPAVLSMRGVKHLKMRIEDAWPLLLKELKGKDSLVNLWVSDMCLHLISSQVDALLLAIELGIVKAGSMFVLTLKCTGGYTKASFDSQAQLEVDRLKDITRGLKVMHLFSNRIGERTIIGYIK
jgi:23S rRNA U2552 (ribose-2'-O)-methylase RlmE/FtsJ